MQFPKFTQSDIVNQDEWIPAGVYNPHNVRPWLLHDHGFVVAVVFASCLQDALDSAVDGDKMDRYLVTLPNADYPDEDSLAYLGNASEAFDIDTLQVIELPNVKMDFALLFDNQHRKES